MLSPNDMELQQQDAAHDCKPDYSERDLTGTHTRHHHIDHLEQLVGSLGLDLRTSS